MPNDSEKLKIFKKNQENEIKKSLLNISGIPKQYLNFNWKSYDPENDSRNIINDKKVIESRKKAKEAALKYVLNIKENLANGKNLLFLGPKTSGKTVLATLILREIISKELCEVRYTRFVNLVSSQFNNLYKITPDELKNLYDYYTEPDVLCIDEIEEIYVRDYVQNCIHEILIDRLNQKKPTIITSRISLGKIKKTCGNGFYDIINDNQIFDICSIGAESYFLTDDSIDADELYLLEDAIKGLVYLLKKEKEIKNKYNKYGYDDKLFVNGSKIIQEISKFKKNKSNIKDTISVVNKKTKDHIG